MYQDYDNDYRTGSKSIILQGKRFSGRKIKWLTLAACVVVFLVAVMALTQGAFSGTQGAHAASAKPGVKSAKHAHSPSSPGKSKPVLSASPLSLSFSASAASPVPSFQVVSIKNSGARALYWIPSVSPATVTWITLPALKSQSSGIRTSSDQPGQLKVYVNPAKLSVGTYKAQITVTGTDQQSQPAGGSPQTVTVTLTVS